MMARLFSLFFIVLCLPVDSQSHSSMGQCKMQIKEPENGVIVSSINKTVGSVIRFKCNHGYNLEGSEALSCTELEHWNTTEPICKKITCDELKEIEHGQISFSDTERRYGSIARVTCKDGYVKHGWFNPKCRADGTWDALPTCKHSPCGTHPALNSSCIHDAMIQSKGTLLTITCESNSDDVSVTQKGDGSDICEEKKWQHTSLGCFCDCKMSIDRTRIDPKNLNDRSFLRHGEVLNWDCLDGYKKNDTVTVIKCSDGTLTGTPRCVRDEREEIKETTSNQDQTLIFVVLSLICVGICVVAGLFVWRIIKNIKKR